MSVNHIVSADRVGANTVTVDDIEANTDVIDKLMSIGAEHSILINKATEAIKESIG